MIEDNSSRAHGYRRLRSSAGALLVAVSILIGLALTHCVTVMPTPTAVPSPPTEPAPAVQQNRLPPFVLDLDLPSDIVLNAEQGLGQCHWVDPSIVSNPLVSWAYDSSEASSGWNKIEPAPGVFQWEALDAEIAKAQSHGMNSAPQPLLVGRIPWHGRPAS